MAFVSVAKGVDATSLYGDEESAYGTAGSTITTPFGNGASVHVGLNNNTERLFALGDRNAQKLVTKKLDVSWDTNFSLGNAYFLKWVMGTISSSSGSGPYIRTYGEANTLPSMTIQNAFNLDTDSFHSILGAKVNSLTLNCNAGEIATARMEGFAQKMVKTSTLGTTDSGDDEDPLIFSGASVRMGSTTGLDVQSLEISIGNNIEMLYGLGSRFATKAVAKGVEYSFKINEAYEDDTQQLDNFLGSDTQSVTSPANLATLIATFTNGLASTNTRELVVTFANVQLPTYDYTMDIKEIIKEDTTYWALDCSGFKYTNNSTLNP